MTQRVLHLDLAKAPRSELAAYAKRRRLIVDWSTATCCGTLIGDLRLRWQRPTEPLDPDLVTVEGLEPVEALCRPELASVLERARARVEMRGFGPFRRPTIVLEHASAWLDFLDTPLAHRSPGAARRTRPASDQVDGDV